MNDKDDVIAHLVMREPRRERREALYRIWCGITRVSVLRTDLDRLRAARRREAQRALKF